MSICGDKSIKLGKLCISNDDYLIILINIFITIIVISLFYIKRISYESQNLSVGIKNNFILLGEGTLNNFYTPFSMQQKSSNTKKKVQSKSNQQIPQTVEKVINNNELKCNNCGRSVEVSYQFTMHKLNAS
jgi:hypothetical protein